MALAVLACPRVWADDSTAEVNLTATVTYPCCVFTLPARNTGYQKATLQGFLLVPRFSSSTTAVNFGWDTVSHSSNPTAYSYWTAPRTMWHGGVFYKQLTGLTPGTTYYFVAKGVCDEATSYGEEMCFTTPPKKHWYPWYWWNWFCG
jgi:hypothetical protein